MYSMFLQERIVFLYFYPVGCIVLVLRCCISRSGLTNSLGFSTLYCNINSGFFLSHCYFLRISIFKKNTKISYKIILCKINSFKIMIFISLLCSKVTKAELYWKKEQISSLWVRPNLQYLP